MEKEFIPYEQAVALRELEFDEPCFGFYKEFGDKWLIMMPTQLTQYEQNNLISCIKNSSLLEAPTFSQVFRWFRENYSLSGLIEIGTQEFSYQVYNDNGNRQLGTEPLKYNGTYEEAELECLKKLIEIVKSKK